MFFTRSRKECSSETEEKLYSTGLPASLCYLSLFLTRSKRKNVALSGQHERKAGKHEPETLFISSMSISHARFLCQQGSAWVVELLRVAEQAASQSASQLSGKYQFLVAICVGV